jgi:hypothetical protein
MAKGSKTVCPECGLAVESKNLGKHFRKMHPGLDPRRIMLERKVEKPRRTVKELPRSRIAGLFISLFVLLILIAAVLFFLSFDQDGDSTPDGPKKIWYTSGDGAIINGTFYKALHDERPTIYLVHDIGDDRSVWNEYAEELQDSDYNVLAIDLRGHGESTKNVKTPDISYEWSEMTHDDLLKIQLDIQGAYRWVHGEDEESNKNTEAGENGAMIGVGRGGLFALSQTAKMSRERIMSSVIISPLLDVYSLDVEQVFEDYGDVRPVMLAASEDDTVAGLAIDRIIKRKEADGETNGIVHKVSGGKVGMPLLENGGLKESIIETMELGFDK